MAPKYGGDDHCRVALLCDAFHFCMAGASPIGVHFMSRATVSAAPPNHSCHVWITDIITQFTLIVSTASKPLRGRFTHAVTMMGNQVMMTVIHTTHVILSAAKDLCMTKATETVAPHPTTH